MDDDCICLSNPLIGRFGPARWGDSCPRHGSGQLTAGLAGCKCKEVDWWNIDITGCPKHDRQKIASDPTLHHFKTNGFPVEACLTCGREWGEHDAS